nr:MAG TPA: hypothetical protein [Caudoviricetes sp.]
MYLFKEMYVNTSVSKLEYYSNAESIKQNSLFSL